MTDEQSRVLSLMEPGREYTSGDIETLSTVRGWYFGGPRNIGRIMADLRNGGRITRQTVGPETFYRRATE